MEGHAGRIYPANQVDALIDIFRFDPHRSDADISLTPLVDLGKGYLALSPTAVLRSNFPRNVLILLIRNSPNEYSSYTGGRDAIRQFLSVHTHFLQKRGLIDRPTEPSDFEFLLLCKGHLGSETIQSEGILKCDYDVFLQAIVERGSGYALELAREYSYLPTVGVDFIVEPISVWYGQWRLSWWTLLPTALPADEESGSRARFLLRLRPVPAVRQ